MKYLTTLFAFLMLSSTNVFAGPVGPGSCSNSDVSANLIGGGSVDANYCVNVAGNDTGFENDINTTFNSAFSSLNLSYDWSFAAKTESFADASSTGIWNFENFDISTPFTIVLKATDNFAAYLFDASTSGTGIYDTIGVTDDGKAHDISHITLYVADINEVPVPAAVWLFGTGIISLIGFRKRYAKK